MMKTLIALYQDATSAREAVDALLSAGFSGDDISLLVNNAQGKHVRFSAQEIRTGEGVGFGAVVGALVGIGSALVPGIGPVLGVGPLAIALTAGIGAAAGALTGGVTAGLLELGLDDETTRSYAEGLRFGGTIVGVTTNTEWLEWAETIVARYHPVRVEEREARQRGSGWSGFDLQVNWRDSFTGYGESGESPSSQPSSGAQAKERARIYER